MEKTKKGVVIPMEANWSDIGSWSSIWENENKDENGNVIIGKVFKNNLRNSYIKSESRLIVASDLNNLVVVETNDAILISKKDKSQNIKEIVQNLSKSGFAEATKHRRIYRPWGNYLSIAEDLKWQVKRIEVKPGAKLSMQMHFHRAEHWVVVKGKAKIEVDNIEKIMGPNESVYIPLGVKHRLSNPTKLPLTLIEIQSGSYLGEDDIVRFKDIYNR